MRKAFVTGGSGFIGRSLVSELRSRGWVVEAPTRHALDLLVPGSACPAIAQAQPSAVYHLASAGVFSRDPGDSDLIANEISIARNVAQACRPGTCLIIAGSMAEYGRSGRLREDMECSPRTAYAQGKYEAGRVAADIAERAGVETVRARIFGAYGPGEDPRRLFPSVVDALTQGRGIDLSDGEQRRDFVHVSDVAAALADLAISAGRRPEIVNVGTGCALQIRDVLQRLAAELRAPVDWLRFGARERAINDEAVSEADTSILFEATGRRLPQRLACEGAILTALGMTAFSPRVRSAYGT